MLLTIYLQPGEKVSVQLDRMLENAHFISNRNISTRIKIKIIKPRSLESLLNLPSNRLNMKLYQLLKVRDFFL